MKFTVPLWPVLMMLAGAIIVGLIVGHVGWILAGFTMASSGWLTAISEGVRDRSLNPRDE